MRPEPLSKRKVKQLLPPAAIRAVAQAERGNESSDDEYYLELVADSMSQGRDRKRPKTKDPHLLRLSLDTGEPDTTMTDEEYESRIAFCCKVCHCPRTVKAQYQGRDYIQASRELVLWHRRCCHTHEVHDETWASPYLRCLQEVHEELYMPPCSSCERSKGGKCLTCRMEQMMQQGIEQVDPIDTLRKYQQNIKEANEICSEEYHEVINDRLRTNPIYAKHEKKFRRIQAKAKNQVQSKAAVVLDLFGGIGSSVVVLKRLKIAMAKIIHVEHDKVANYVYKYWHCYKESNNNKDKDGIEHIFISSFDTFEHKLTQIMNEHGPFDIVVGGPPCVDYTLVNARRLGVDGVQGSYLLRMGEVIKRIRTFNKNEHRNLFFLAENAVLWNEKEKAFDAGDLETVLRAFGMTWHITLDSRDHTPLRRKRTYITNIPIVEDLKMIDPPPSLCFEDGYDVAGMIFDPESGLSKAAGLMANKLRLDDHPRMSIYKEYGKRDLKFYRRTPNVAERERLMGLPPNYVSEPLKKLFSSLIYGGFAAETVEINKKWEDCLAKEFHEFAGDHHRFCGRWPPFLFYSAPTSDTDPTPSVKLKLAPPLATQTPQYYTEEEYGKRLIGNAFSIPTVEFLLRPIKPFFARREYSDFDYVYAWTGWDPAQDSQVERSTRVRALMYAMAANKKAASPMLSVSNDENDILSNRKMPPNAIMAARARQSAGKIFLPPIEAMDEVERYRLSTGSPSDDDADAKEAENFDV